MNTGLSIGLDAAVHSITLLVYLSMFSSFKACFTVALFFCAAPSFALYPVTTFDEIAQTADLVFTGTVTSIDHFTSGPAAFTEVSFDAVSKIRSSTASRQRDASSIKLTHVGGPINGIYMNVSGAPQFRPGRKYMVFMLDDGSAYINPVVAGTQGVFEVVADPATGKEVLASSSGKLLTGIDSKGMPQFTSQPMAPASAKSPATSATIDRNINATAVSSDGSVSADFNPRANAAPTGPMSVDSLTSYILNTAVEKSLPVKKLQINSKRRGRFYGTENGKVTTSDIPLTALDNIELPIAPPTPEALETRGQNLITCGAQDLLILFEQLPSGSFGYDINNHCMAHFNDYLDAYRTTASNGSIGFFNGQNELCGFINGETLNRVFGFQWDGAIGLCIHYTSNSSTCVPILEADIFYNPEYDYSDDPYTWFNTTNPYLHNLRMVANHELGHSWGYQIKVEEQYDYDAPSIMHGSRTDIFETGRGLHATDAYLFRRLYNSQTTPRSITDVGIEAYYAQNGLNSATFDQSSYTRGSKMTFTGVTSENLGQSTAHPRVRFYLSTAHDFTGTYYQVGGDWTFSNGLSPESYSQNNFADNTIPSHVQAGTYYVLAYIDLPGATENFTSNNIGVFTDRVTIHAPTITRSTSSLSRTIRAGESAAAQSFTIRNSGTGRLQYSMSISYNQGSTGWLSVSPVSGTSTGESDTITVNYNSTGLPVGYHSAYINISDPNATNSGQTVLVSITVDPQPAPAHDHLRNASPLSDTSNVITGTNLGATKESGEANHAGKICGASVWYSWTAPASGTMVMDTHGSNFDTVLGIYTGTSFPLTERASNDDSGGGTTSAVTFNVASAETYKIAVDGYNAAVGQLTLRWTFYENSSAADWNLY